MAFIEKRNCRKPEVQLNFILKIVFLYAVHLFKCFTFVSCVKSKLLGLQFLTQVAMIQQAQALEEQAKLQHEERLKHRASRKAGLKT